MVQICPQKLYLNSNFVSSTTVYICMCVCMYVCVYVCMWPEAITSKNVWVAIVVGSFSLSGREGGKEREREIANREPFALAVSKRSVHIDTAFVGSSSAFLDIGR